MILTYLIEIVLVGKEIIYQKQEHVSSTVYVLCISKSNGNKNTFFVSLKVLRTWIQQDPNLLSYSSVVKVLTSNPGGTSRDSNPQKVANSAFDCWSLSSLSSMLLTQQQSLTTSKSSHRETLRCAGQRRLSRDCAEPHRTPPHFFSKQLFAFFVTRIYIVNWLEQ